MTPEQEKLFAYLLRYKYFKKMPIVEAMYNLRTHADELPVNIFKMPDLDILTVMVHFYGLKDNNKIDPYFQKSILHWLETEKENGRDYYNRGITLWYWNFEHCIVTPRKKSYNSINSMKNNTYIGRTIDGVLITN